MNRHEVTIPKTQVKFHVLTTLFQAGNIAFFVGLSHGLEQTQDARFTCIHLQI